MTLTSYGEAGGVEALTNYLEDDWDDDALTGRSNPNTGVFREQLSGGVGDLLKGIYRPEWTVASGSVSASGGVMQVPAGDTTVQMAETPSQIEVGAWAYDMIGAGSSSSGIMSFVFFGVDDSYTGGEPDNGYCIVRGSAESILRKYNSGTSTNLVGGGPAMDSTNYRFESTRDEDGNFEFLVDGTSKGTATDTTFDTCAFVFTTTNLDVSYDIDNLAVN